MRVKSESLPFRCEICHKSDCFDAINNYCTRCECMEFESIHYFDSLEDEYYENREERPIISCFAISLVILKSILIGVFSWFINFVMVKVLHDQLGWVFIFWIGLAITAQQIYVILKRHFREIYEPNNYILLGMAVSSLVSLMMNFYYDLMDRLLVGLVTGSLLGLIVWLVSILSNNRRNA